MSRRQVNLRLSDLTRGQLAELCRRLAASEATIVTVAVDRMYREMNQLAETGTEEIANGNNKNSTKL